jgi:2-succinyl-6-hydroxy-2,4-cyclohexadiene-1-carboxylate synthase
VLHSESRGQGAPVVLLHGFTQSGDSWAPITDKLATGHRVITIDAPGHGRSSQVQAGLDEGADMMVAVAPRPASWVGYSMGGRFALHAALRHPDVIDRLVLVSTTAGIDDQAQRGDRRAADAALANRIEKIGVKPFLEEWLAQPLFASLPAGAAVVESRLGSTAEGLASSLRLAGAGEQEPLWQRLSSLSMPVLVVAGELDSKYVALGERLVGSIGPNASLRVIRGAGHACHLEEPAAFLDAVESFLPRT